MKSESRQERLMRGVAAANADDRQISDAKPIEAISDAIRRPGLRLAQIVATVMEGYADRPALGQRAFELTTAPATGRRTRLLSPAFETITYRELWARAGDVASAWAHTISPDAPEFPLHAGDFVAVLGFTSTDYTTVDLACLRLGAVNVPLPAGASVRQLTEIIVETEPRVLAVSADLVETAVDCVVAGGRPQVLMIFDYHPEDDDQRDVVETARRRLADVDSAVVFECFSDVLGRGRGLPPAPLFVPDPNDNPLSLLIYTSGSTGTPKGAMYTERTAAALWLGAPGIPVININYMPMSHIAGRITLNGVLARGGTAYFTARKDLSTLFDDISMVRPTELLFVPRVCELVFQRYQSEMERRSGPGTDETARADIDRKVRAELRQRFFGERLMLAMCSSAPLSAEMKTFMESVLDMEIHEGYSSTETGPGVMLDNQLCRPPVIDYKLIDVPELGCFLTDKPHPRGELLLKTTNMTAGYYKRPQLSAEIFDGDGFYRTGDIMAEIGPDRLVYVDRRNNVLKLSQGEFVATAHLEAVFAAGPLIRQIFIHGSSERTFLLAVIVPTEDALARYADRAALTAAVAESLRLTAKDAALSSYEIPRAFMVDTEPFTVDNGLLSGIGKLLRPRLKQLYGERLEKLYADVVEAQAHEMRALRTGVANRPVLETIIRAARALLGVGNFYPDAHFTDLGGDSLSALSLSNLLRESLDVEVPVGVVTSPATNLRDLANYVEQERNSGTRRPTSASVHGDGTTINADDLTLNQFIDAETLTDAKSLSPTTAAPRTVLLTGANGYLGRFLCLSWLKHLDATDGTLICLVRGSDAATARQRLVDAFDSGDPELTRHFRGLADRIEVLAGDISLPNLGVDERTWQRLAERVDLIVHPAALVNHVLPYSQLFGPNVVGTAEVIRLAITTRLKPVTYLSTVAVAAQIESSICAEDGDIREISSTRIVDDGYANGYGNSKWAGEVLLREAHELFGLPIAVFRSDMILAHSRYAGQLNVQDMFTRLLISVLATGLAPYSFYETGPDGGRRRAHYDGLPVDFTAEAITELGARATAGFRTYNVLNPHKDGVSLDEFVDWLIEAGHPIHRIDDYDEWFTRFETALRALPERHRQRSALPLLHAYRRPRRAVPGSAVPAERFHAAVRLEGIGPDQDIPHLTASFIAKYVADLRQLGLL